MDLEWWQLALLASLGILAGILNVIAGGGSLLTLPTMIFMGLPEAVANGTNRVAILAQNISAITGFRRKGFSDFKLSLTLALASVPGAVLGAHTGAIIRGDLFNVILALIMIGIIILMAGKRKSSPNKNEAPEGVPLTPARLIGGHLGMVVVGFYGGFIQAGVGFLLMAVLHRVMKLDLVRVNMHKVFIVATFTVVALVVYLYHGKVWWIPGLCLALGNASGGWIGAHLSISKGETFIRRVLYVALLAMAAKLLIG